MKLSQLFNLPNALTLINLFSGCMAVVFVFNYHIDWVPYCISISLVADFLDGFAARWTKTSSDIGKQLDSLADVISFGLLPGAVVYFMILQIMERNSNASLPIAYLIAYSAVAFLITLFAALRLAKFNVDERQSDGFIGLATPAATIFVWGSTGGFSAQPIWVGVCGSICSVFVCCYRLAVCTHDCRTSHVRIQIQALCDGAVMRFDICS
jgi:CDP-diacylglycerol--serine O-phosphatidyltransferase